MFTCCGAFSFKCVISLLWYLFIYYINFKISILNRDYANDSTGDLNLPVSCCSFLSEDGDCIKENVHLNGCLKYFLEFSTSTKHRNFTTKQQAFALEILTFVLSVYMLKKIDQDKKEEKINPNLQV